MDTSFWIALISLVVSVVGGMVGFLWNASAIRREQRDRKEALSDAWAREWGAQHALVCPHLSADYLYEPSTARHPDGRLLFPLKNAGRGPAINVHGSLTLQTGENQPVEQQILAGIIAAGEQLDARLDPPLVLGDDHGRPARPASYLAGAQGIIQFQDLAQYLMPAGKAWETRFHVATVSAEEIDISTFGAPG